MAAMPPAEGSAPEASGGASDASRRPSANRQVGQMPCTESAASGARQRSQMRTVFMTRSCFVASPATEGNSGGGYRGQGAQNSPEAWAAAECLTLGEVAVEWR